MEQERETRHSAPSHCQAELIGLQHWVREELVAAKVWLADSQLRLSRVSQDYFKDLHRLLILAHVAFHFNFLSHFAFDHLWIADFGNLAIVLNEHSIPTFVSAVSVTGRLAAALTDACGIADHTRHLHGVVLLGIKHSKRSQNDREQENASFHLKYLQRQALFGPKDCDVEPAAGVAGESGAAGGSRGAEIIHLPLRSVAGPQST
jgi:hypothetical protein